MLIADCWSQLVFGCPMFILSQKLKYVKVKLKIWNKQVFGDVHKLVQNSTNHLNNIQCQIQNLGMNDNLKSQEPKAQQDFKDDLDKDEYFWMEKSRIRWNK